MWRLAIVIAAGCRGESVSEHRPAAPPSPAIPADATPPSRDLQLVKQTEHALDWTTVDDATRLLDTMDKATLVSLARDGACRWAAPAAFALERRGDDVFLPRRGAANTPAELSRLLCLIANIPTRDGHDNWISTPQLEFLRDFLPPSGTVSVRKEECNGEGRPSRKRLPARTQPGTSSPRTSERANSSTASPARRREASRAPAWALPVGSPK